jgi:hypothetical protein
MQDALFLLLALGFFALTWGLVLFAGRLEEAGEKGGKP